MPKAARHPKPPHTKKPRTSLCSKRLTPLRYNDLPCFLPASSRGLAPRLFIEPRRVLFVPLGTADSSPPVLLAGENEVESPRPVGTPESRSLQPNLLHPVPRRPSPDARIGR